MATTQKFDIEGLKELVDALSDLPEALQRKIIKATLVKAGKKFIVNELKSSLTYSETLKDSLRVVNDPHDKNAISAGVTAGKRVDGKIPAGVLLRFLDRGTVVRHTKRGYNRGAITPRNEVAPVIDSEIQPIIDFFNNDLGDEIKANLERRIKRVNKKLNS
jgi:hypothetical protein